MNPKAVLERERRELSRLETLMDVMFALMLWAIVAPLPLPEPAGRLSFGFVVEFLIENSSSFFSAFIGVVLIIVYWAQSNALLGNLARTNSKHAASAIFQVVFLMLYAYSMRLGELLPDLIGPYVLQSAALAGLGFSGVIGWSYAMKSRHLISDSITEEGAQKLLLSVLTEPVTAVITIPFAFMGGIAWELSWLLYLPIAALLRWRHARRNGPGSDTTSPAI